MTDYERGYRAGIEAAAQAVAAHHIERFNGEVIRLDAVAESIRALSPAAPDAERSDAPDATTDDEVKCVEDVLRSICREKP